MQNSIIAVSPIGDIDQNIIESIREAISSAYGFGTVVLNAFDDITFAHNHTREQYHSTAILEKLEESIAAENVLKVIAITDKDLFIPILTYVFGEAQLGGKACILSLHRLMEGDRPAIICRVTKEAVHELGHTFSLRHCKEKQCVMGYSRGTQDVDRKGSKMCRYCTVLLNDELKKILF